MSTTDVDTATHADTHGGHDEHHELSDGTAVKIAIFLAVVTAIEVALSYMIDELGALFLPLLLGLMALKFFMVVAYFMHLRFDSRVFRMFFYVGLILAVGSYVAVMLTFHFFQS